MNSKSLLTTNRYLKNTAKAKVQLVRSVASSTAIETGEPIKKIEATLNRLRSLTNLVKLA
jgi:hypothetical protein